MVTLLVGASGLLGTALKNRLSGPIRQLVRRPVTPGDDPDTRRWNSREPLPPEILDGVSTVINLGGAGVGERRWSRSRVDLLRTSRTIPTTTLALALAERAEPVRYLQASAVGYYGDTGDTPAGEDAPAGHTVLSDLTAAWEQAAAPAMEAGHPTTLLRTGIVLSPDGGALGPLLQMVRLGLGGPLGSGEQWWPWIHVDDWVAAVAYLLTGDLTENGVTNGWFPQPS